jgi:nucleotide sugar dehydrogenase
MKIVVVGGGKMGLPLACMFSHRGARVTVCDKNPSIVDCINGGRDPHGEAQQDGLVREAVERNLMRASYNTAAEAADADVIVVLVSASLNSDNDIDWGNLTSASSDIAKGLRKGALVCYETTVPVGSCRGVLVPILEHSGFKAGADFLVVYSPERVKSGFVFARLANTPKIVGGFDASSTTAGTNFYRRWLGAPVIDVGSLEAAEFVKLAGMVYRDVNIALANELAAFSEVVGLDIWPILRAANTDGETALLQPGIGVGGHCTPVYPHFLIKHAQRCGIRQELAATSRHINDQQPARQIERLSLALQGLSGCRIHILGLAFRPQVPEDAYSPAVALRDCLLKAGATVTIEDPLYDAAALISKGFTPGRIDCDVDAVVLHTAHEEFADPDFNAWRMAGVRAIVDGRAFWSREKIEAARLIYIGVGISSANALDVKQSIR